MQETKKTYVLDTNILLNSAEAIFKFEDNLVIIPMTVIEELDNFKKNMDELGRNARKFARYLDELRAAGSLTEGVPLNDVGGVLKVELYNDVVKQGLHSKASLDFSVYDNQILAAAFHNKGSILISNDVNLRIKADALGLQAEGYSNSKVEVETLYSGSSVHDVSANIIQQLYDTDVVPLDATGLEEPFPNHNVILRSEANEKQAVLCRYNAVMKHFERLPQDLSVSGLVPRSSEQQFALSMLLDPEVELVTLIGLAGSGKTLCALAAGLHSVLETKQYKKLLLLKPIMAMGNSNQLGYLPGSASEKLAPWMASYVDNIDFLMDNEKYSDVAKTISKGSKKRKAKEVVDEYDEKAAGKLPAAQELVAQGFIEMGSLEHLRGRSLPNMYILIDECQNCSPSVIKTIVTRAGEGSKIVLMGDIAQLDSPYLDASSNGLVYVTSRFSSSDLSGHLTLRKSERSRLAALATELL